MKVYTEEYLAKFEVLDEQYPEQNRNLRDARARFLRKTGWTVKCGKVNFADLARTSVYILEAIREKGGDI